VRILLDACVPRKVARELRGHEVKTARQMGWHNSRDSELLDRMAGQFDVLTTMDKSLRYQQLLQHRPLAILVLRAKSNRLPDLLPLVPNMLQALNGVKSGQVIEVSEMA
jgi:predicted nuclease of predicted toxin-antitoxin system